MSISIKLNQVLQQTAGKRERVEVTGNTVRQCLGELTRLFPGTKNWLFNKDNEPAALILINGEALKPDELNKPVKDGDGLYILTIISGG